MATVVSAETVKCTWCGATAIVRIWSCCCQGTSRSGPPSYYGHNNATCSGISKRFFEHLERDCGKGGPVSSH